MMARMRSDLVPVIQGAVEGQLHDSRIEWAREPAVCVVLAARGYPDSPDTGAVVEGLDDAEKMDDVVVFHGATARRDGQTVTVGGRVLGVTALGPNLEAAVQRAYEAVDRVRFEGMYYRKDIGRRALARLQASREARP
jgi:phosphoribosylamine--glycine ligase